MDRRRPRTSLSPPRPSVVDHWTGIIPSILEVEMHRYDPDVFVASAEIRSCNAPAGAPDTGSGAGLTPKAAWWAAVGEGVERYALAIVHPEDLIFGSCAGLRRLGHDPIGPSSWALFHPSQYARLPFHRFGEETPIAWVQADSLTKRRHRLVPACLVHLPYAPAFAERGEKVIAAAISTGAACARSPDEAMLKGVCELIERDAFMIMWRNRLPCPRVSIDEASRLYPLFRERFARPGLHYTLVSTTLDLPLPSFCGILVDARREPPGILVGGACDPDPERAALKTLLELVQGLKWRDFVGPQTFQTEEAYRNVRSFEDRTRLYAFGRMGEAFRFLRDHPREIPLSSIPAQDAGAARPNLDRCVGLLAERGLEVVAVDLTPVDAEACGLVVTRVLIPGCEVMEGDHLAPHLGGWRWREVPHRLGLLPDPPGLDAINPDPHPYP